MSLEEGFGLGWGWPFSCGKKIEKGEGGVGRVGVGVGTGKGTGKSMHTRLSKLPFSKLACSLSGVEELTFKKGLLRDKFGHFRGNLLSQKSYV